MKDHIRAKMVNSLRGVAIEFHNHGSLRARILEVVLDGELEQLKWEQNHD